MARKKRVTSDVLSSMKMLHTQGVKVSMIAKVLGFSNWTVYQGLNAGWDFDTYRTKQREHFDKQAKQVKSNGVTMNDDISFTVAPVGVDTASTGNLTVSGVSELGLVSDKLTSIAGGLVEINRNLGQLVSIFQRIDDE
tara:strand:+ start:459 stop:872 length:414 start_codon:yes stop_codon:yes gene_type:complete